MFWIFPFSWRVRELFGVIPWLSSSMPVSREYCDFRRTSLLWWSQQLLIIWESQYCNHSHVEVPSGVLFWQPHLMISCACLQANRDNDVLMWFSHGRSLASFAALSYVSCGKRSNSHVRILRSPCFFIYYFIFSGRQWSQNSSHIKVSVIGSTSVTIFLWKLLVYVWHKHMLFNS